MINNTVIREIPFSELLYPYIYFDDKFMELDHSIKEKLKISILKELSSYAELVLQKELENFTKIEDATFDDFIKKKIDALPTEYPVLDEMIKTKVVNFSNHITKIVDRFKNDIENIIDVFHLNTNYKNLKITDIDISLGDGHNGEGTALISLSDGTKLVYKPRNIEITNSYNSFIDWINSNLGINLKTFKIFNRAKYGWLEYVEHEALDSEEQLAEYYYKAGALLATTLLLGSKDYHRENIIASGENPVLIDHETIIQPYLENHLIKSWDKEHKIPPFSVLDSVLIINSETGVSSEFAGYGVNGHIETTEVDKKVINPNTLDSKRVIRYTTRKLVEKNIPIYNNNYIFANQYKEKFKNGFSEVYDLFIKSKEELTSEFSPIRFFQHKETRYVWRPTFVYFKILKFLRNPAFMSNFVEYHSKLYDLLSKAYKNENMKEYRFILDFEMKQMLKGDIPIFNLGSTENFLEGNENFKIFKYNCLENIYNRIESLSENHKEKQIGYINNWLNL